MRGSSPRMTSIRRWAKTLLRHAHHLISIVILNGGHATVLDHPLSRVMTIASEAKQSAQRAALDLEYALVCKELAVPTQRSSHDPHRKHHRKQTTGPNYHGSAVAPRSCAVHRGDGRRFCVADHRIDGVVGRICRQGRRTPAAIKAAVCAVHRTITHYADAQRGGWRPRRGGVPRRRDYRFRRALRQHLLPRHPLGGRAIARDDGIYGHRPGRARVATAAGAHIAANDSTAACGRHCAMAKQKSGGQRRSSRRAHRSATTMQEDGGHAIGWRFAPTRWLCPTKFSLGARVGAARPKAARHWPSIRHKTRPWRRSGPAPRSSG